MSNIFRETRTVLGLALSNSWRWRWRLLTVAVLVVLSFSLHVLYGAYLSGVAASGNARTVPLNTKYYDVLVVPDAEQSIKSLDEMPIPRYRRNLYGHGEEAIGLSVRSSFGDMELLGLQQDSVFFDFDDEALQGRALQRAGDLLLPRGFVEQAGLNLGATIALNRIEDFRRLELELTLVGIYTDDFDLPPALVLYEDAASLQIVPRANRYLLNYNRAPGEATLEYTLEWLRAAYPGALLVSNQATEDLARSLLSRILQPGNGLLALIFVFMGIGVLTVALMTFLERRKEMAALKSIGISNGQMVIMLVLEYAWSLIFGILGGIGIVVLLSAQLPWLSETSVEVLWDLGRQAALNTIFVLVLALLFPVMTARVATVNQLLFARTIPLRVTRVNHLQKPEGWLLLREQEENVRLLKLPQVESEPDFICFKQIGDTVKQGEVVASMEMMWGLRILEWAALCDGIVVDYNAGGLMAIRPSDPQTPFYPYPAGIVELEREKNAKITRARLAAKQEMGATK